jgi:hypothetical protein
VSKNIRKRRRSSYQWFGVVVIWLCLPAAGRRRDGVLKSGVNYDGELVFTIKFLYEVKCHHGENVGDSG